MIKKMLDSIAWGSKSPTITIEGNFGKRHCIGSVFEQHYCAMEKVEVPENFSNKLNDGAEDMILIFASIESTYQIEDKLRRSIKSVNMGLDVENLDTSTENLIILYKIYLQGQNEKEYRILKNFNSYLKSQTGIDILEIMENVVNSPLPNPQNY